MFTVHPNTRPRLPIMSQGPCQPCVPQAVGSRLQTANRRLPLGSCAVDDSSFWKLKDHRLGWTGHTAARGGAGLGGHQARCWIPLGAQGPREPCLWDELPASGEERVWGSFDPPWVSLAILNPVATKTPFLILAPPPPRFHLHPVCVETSQPGIQGPCSTQCLCTAPGSVMPEAEISGSFASAPPPLPPALVRLDSSESVLVPRTCCLSTPRAPLSSLFRPLHLVPQPCTTPGGPSPVISAIRVLLSTGQEVSAPWSCAKELPLPVEPLFLEPHLL